MRVLLWNFKNFGIFTKRARAALQTQTHLTQASNIPLKSPDHASNLFSWGRSISFYKFLHEQQA